MIALQPYLIYIKLGAAALLLGAVAATSYHFGGMASKTKLEGFQAEQAKNTAKAVLAERAAAVATAAADHATEMQHAKELRDIDSLAPIATPLLVYRTAPAAVCTVPGAEGKAGGLAADPAGRGGEPVGGGRDIRPDIEALKKRLEKVMADYRQLDHEWQH